MQSRTAAGHSDALSSTACIVAQFDADSPSVVVAAAVVVVIVIIVVALPLVPFPGMAAMTVASVP